MIVEQWSSETPIGKFWWAVGYRQARTPQERAGQNTFNTLCIYRPDLSEQIRGTELDAFYNNARLDAMCEWIEAHWKDCSDEELRNDVAASINDERVYD